MQERFANGIYRDCKFCHGRGCLACPGEADAEYKRQFPDGPKPMATFKTDDPADMAIAKETIGAEAITKAFREGGGGVQEIRDNLRAHGRLEDE